MSPIHGKRVAGAPRVNPLVESAGYWLGLKFTRPGLTCGWRDDLAQFGYHMAMGGSVFSAIRMLVRRHRTLKRKRA